MQYKCTVIYTLNGEEFPPAIMKVPEDEDAYKFLGLLQARAAHDGGAGRAAGGGAAGAADDVVSETMPCSIHYADSKKTLYFTIKQNQEIGSGASGKVYEVSYTEQPVGIPRSLLPSVVLKCSCYSDPSNVFSHEASIWEYYKQPGEIVALSSSKKKLLMPQCSGKSLAEWLQDPLEIDRELALLSEVVKAVIKFHKNHIHGDLHTGNIYINTEEERESSFKVKFIDYEQAVKPGDPIRLLDLPIQNDLWPESHLRGTMASEKAAPSHDWRRLAYDLYYEFGIFSPTVKRMYNKEIILTEEILSGLEQDYQDLKAIEECVKSNDFLSTRPANEVEENLLLTFPSKQTIVDWYFSRKHVGSENEALWKHCLTKSRDLFPVSQTSVDEVISGLSPDTRQKWTNGALSLSLVKYEKKINMSIYDNILKALYGSPWIFSFIFLSGDKKTVAKGISVYFNTVAPYNEISDRLTNQGIIESILTDFNLKRLRELARDYINKDLLDYCKKHIKPEVKVNLLSSEGKEKDFINNPEVRAVGDHIKALLKFYYFYRCAYGRRIYDEELLDKFGDIHREVKTDYIDFSTWVDAVRKEYPYKKTITPLILFNLSNIQAIYATAVEIKKFILTKAPFLDLLVEEIRDIQKNYERLTEVQRTYYQKLISYRICSKAIKLEIESMVGILNFFIPSHADFYKGTYSVVTTLDFSILRQKIDVLLLSFPQRNRFFVSLGIHSDNISIFHERYNSLKALEVSEKVKKIFLDYYLTSLRASVFEKHVQNAGCLPSRTLSAMDQLLNELKELAKCPRISPS